METDSMQPLGGAPIAGYSRSEVDDFLTAAAQERTRLEAAIADATTRASRARAALGMHRVMVAMLLETQRELSELRNDAERQAEEIITAAERDVVLAQGSAPGPRVHEIDLSTVDAAPVGAAPLVAFAGPVPTNGDANGTATAEGDAYFAFLRGALDDDQPLGPPPEA
jgi:hypothetical protein